MKLRKKEVKMNYIKKEKEKKIKIQTKKERKILNSNYEIKDKKHKKVNKNERIKRNKNMRSKMPCKIKNGTAKQIHNKNKHNEGKDE